MYGKGKPALSYYDGSPSGAELDCPTASFQTRYDTVPYLLVVPFIRPAVQSCPKPVRESILFPG